MSYLDICLGFVASLVVVDFFYYNDKKSLTKQNALETLASFKHIE
jgi:hypothetical protein